METKIAAPQYVLIDQEFKDDVMKAINELKVLIASRKEQPPFHDNICWLDNADLMEYLHISRRTTLTLRKKGLPSTQIDGKIFYRKDLVDDFLTKHQVRHKSSGDKSN